MNYKAIGYELREDVAILTLNRPEVMNALSTQMRAEITHAVRRAGGRSPAEAPAPAGTVELATEEVTAAAAGAVRTGTTGGIAAPDTVRLSTSALEDAGPAAERVLARAPAPDPSPGQPEGASRGWLLGAGVALGLAVLAYVWGGGLSEPGAGGGLVEPEEPERVPTSVPSPTPAPIPTSAPTPSSAPASAPTPGTESSPIGGSETARVEQGTLYITTTPAGAGVFLDDRSLGRSPIRTDVDHGKRSVRVELTGYKSDVRAVDLQGGLLHVSFELQPEVKMGKVAVFGVPNSEVSVDGTFVGLIPLQTSLSEGLHAFTVKHPSGESFSTTKEVRFGPGQRTVSINLSTP